MPYPWDLGENNILPSVAILSRDFYFLSLLSMCATVHLWMSEDSFVGLLLSFLLYMGSTDQSLVIRLTWCCLSFQTISSAGKVSFFQFERWHPYYAHCSNKGRTRPETICNLIKITDQWVELLDLSLTVCSGAHDLLLSCKTELRSMCILPEHPRKGGYWSQTASWRMGLRTELRHSPQCCAVCRTVHS